MTYKRYCDSPVMGNLRAFCQEMDLLQVPQRDHLVYPDSGFAHRKTFCSDPYVVSASILYKPGSRAAGLALWSNITASVEQAEEHTYTYLFLADAEDENVVWSFERYENQKYLRDIHIASDAIQQNIEHQKDMRVPGGLHHHYWQQLAELHSSG